MQRLIACSALGLLISVSVVNCATWAQQLGSPTALPPGAANTPGTTGTSRPAQPAGPAGTTSPAGGTRPAGTTQPAMPATMLQSRESFERSQMGMPATRFGSGVSQPPTARTDSGVIFGQQGFNSGVSNNPGVGGNRFGGGTTQMMFERNQAMFDRSDVSGAGNAASSIPGRPNMSGGSTSRTLRPGARIAGDPNNTSSGPGSVPLAPRSNFDNNMFFGGVVSGLNVPFAPAAPIVPLGADFQNAATMDTAPAAPPTQLVPVLVTPGEPPAGGRNNVGVNIQAEPREPPIPQEGVATATAYPTRNPTATGDATVTASPPAATASANGRSQFVEVPTGAAATTTYRGVPSVTGQRSSLTVLHPGYTQWQGYYWHHSPAAGWRYWDGLRWVQFASAQR